jgi:hypothetical protein
VLGVFLRAWMSLVALLVASPAGREVTVNRMPGSGTSTIIAFVVALSGFLTVLAVGVLRRWRWVFWLCRGAPSKVGGHRRPRIGAARTRRTSEATSSAEPAAEHGPPPRFEIRRTTSPTGWKSSTAEHGSAAQEGHGPGPTSGSGRPSNYSREPAPRGWPDALVHAVRAPPPADRSGCAPGGSGLDRPHIVCQFTRRGSASAETVVPCPSASTTHAIARDVSTARGDRLAGTAYGENSRYCLVADGRNLHSPSTHSPPS